MSAAPASTSLASSSSATEMRERRVRAYRSGVFAKTIAAAVLRLRGYAIVARRYKTPVGEIDLVALKGRRLAFVEVKRRKTPDDAARTLPAKQRRRIVRAAQYWLAGHPDFTGHDIAFDVVLTAPWT
jgi:putative endonuclease